ncbi:MAG: ATP-binding cassette domain-containing protein, partial [Rhodococcus sp. (in: high G+C Gram-positive bacteria)]
LQVAGKLDATLGEASTANAASVRARDRAARPGAFADAALPLSIGASVLGSLLVGTTLYGDLGGTAGAMTPMALAVLVLVPLAAFEATSALPAAAIALTKARVSASRIVALLDAAEQPRPTRIEPRVGAETMSVLKSAGARVAVTGSSGAGKTTLLMGLAGILPTADGSVEGGRFFAEDAHLFETSILENLRVARGDVDTDEALRSLGEVGLADWVAELPEGIDTTLVGGARAVSGGQRRRLLLARALLSDAPVLLLDEPTEHLDDAGGAALVRRLLDRNGALLGRDRGVVLVTHRLPADTAADLVIDLDISLSENSAEIPLRTP